LSHNNNIICIKINTWLSNLIIANLIRDLGRPANLFVASDGARADGGTGRMGRGGARELGGAGAATAGAGWARCPPAPPPTSFRPAPPTVRDACRRGGCCGRDCGGGCGGGACGDGALWQLHLSSPTLTIGLSLHLSVTPCYKLLEEPTNL
jgi:hypothetical protein